MGHIRFFGYNISFFIFNWIFFNENFLTKGVHKVKVDYSCKYSPFKFEGISLQLGYESKERINFRKLPNKDNYWFFFRTGNNNVPLFSKRLEGERSFNPYFNIRICGVFMYAGISFCNYPQEIILVKMSK